MSTYGFLTSENPFLTNGRDHLPPRHVFVEECFNPEYERMKTSRLGMTPLTAPSPVPGRTRPGIELAASSPTVYRHGSPEQKVNETRCEADRIHSDKAKDLSFDTMSFRDSFHGQILNEFHTDEIARTLAEVIVRARRSLTDPPSSFLKDPESRHESVFYDDAPGSFAYYRPRCTI